MRVALKLNAIEQEHLQELYDAAGVARDELPYSEQFARLVQDFQDRTFKNADAEQVFGAILKYVRSSTNRASEGVLPDSPLSAEEVKTLKAVLKRHAKGKLLPHSSEFEQAFKEFAGLLGKELTQRDFWMSIVKVQGRTRKPPKRPAKVEVEEEADEE